MYNINLRRAFRSLSMRNLWTVKVLLPVSIGIAVVAVATPPYGFILNQILAKGVSQTDFHQRMQIPKNTNGSVDPWEAEVHTHGATDFYMQHLKLAPGGYSGWHTHPGILIGTVTAGSIDLYDSNCQKRTINPGEIYFENGNVHGIANTGSVDADLSLSFLIKHDAPRRLEADAPACASMTPIP